MNALKTISFLIICDLLLACNPKPKTEEKTDVDTIASMPPTEIVETEMVLPTIEENKIGHVQMNTKYYEAKKANKSAEELKKIAAQKDYKTISESDFAAAMADSGYTAVPITDTLTASESATKLDETASLISYRKHGKEVFQVHKDANGNIDQVVFTDKHHKDVFNVSAGLSGKEVRKLRKDMKHEVKKGKVLMYDDKSNIMYQMNVTDSQTKDSYTDDEVDQMDVNSILWDKNKNKK